MNPLPCERSVHQVRLQGWIKRVWAWLPHGCKPFCELVALQDRVHCILEAEHAQPKRIQVKVR